MPNSIKTGGNTSIQENARDNSSFKGELEWIATAAPPTSCKVKIVRLIEETEQTNDDASIERIETGRSLKGAYYQKDGTGVSFTIEL